MPRRSKVDTLPKAVKDWLDAQLVEGNFSGYEALSAELKKRGYDISKTGLHRYGQAFDERLKALKLATEQARAVVQASPDYEDAMNQALVRMTQQRLFDVLLEMETDPSKVNLSGITRSIAELARASITVKDYAAKVKTRAQDAAAAAESTLQQAGLDTDRIRQITTLILGVPQ